jgi:hypothetical protein
MKKILITLNVLFLGIILFQACNPKSKEKSSVTTTSAESATTDSCGRTVCKDYSGIPLEGVVDGATLKGLSIAYSTDPGKANITDALMPDGSPTKDALSVYFRLDQIKNFIWQMEQVACIAGCDSTRDLAIRIYLIKYPDDLGSGHVAECLKSLPADCSSKHSLALVPAYKRGSEYYDFSLTNFSYDCFGKPIPAGNPAGIKAAAIISMPGSGDNHGGIGPPPPPGTYPTNPL